jgi:ribose 5-phosphate isomerase RpiB
MRIAVLSETSAREKNAEIIEALSGRGFEVINAGMKAAGESFSLCYLHTGFLAGLLFNLGAADFVVGGCGTGIGFMLSAMMYPGVYCGLIGDPLEAWLFNRINAGNCVSLPLNKGWGWGGGVNLGFVFDRLFSGEQGSGYPEHRREPQAESRQKLEQISAAAHKPMEEIILAMDRNITVEALNFPGIRDLLENYGNNKPLARAVNNIYSGG